MKKLYEEFIKEKGWIKYDGKGNPVEKYLQDKGLTKVWFQVIFVEELDEPVINADLFSSMSSDESAQFFINDPDCYGTTEYYKIYDQEYVDRDKIREAWDLEQMYDLIR